MTTTVEIPVLHLVDDRYDDITSVEVYNCSSCGNQVETENLNFNDYYYPGKLLETIKERLDDGIDVDTDLNDVVTNVDTFNAAFCEGCSSLIADDDWSTSWVYACPVNGCYHDGAHDALFCCEGECPGAHEEQGMECHCTRAVHIDFSNLQPTEQAPDLEGTLIFYCFCYDDCEAHICLLCHDIRWDTGSALKHWETAHPEYQQASLPDAIEDPIPDAVVMITDCEMCGSEFCCPAHDTHKNPHNWCHVR